MPYSAASLADPSRASAPLAARRACLEFEKAVGGRGKILEILSHSQGSGPDLDQLLGMIADPRNDEKNLATICMIAGVGFPKLLVLFRDAGVARAQLAAMRRVWDTLPEVAGDVMARSVTHLIKCGACGGSGKLTEVHFTKPKKGEVPDPPQQLEIMCDGCQGTGAREAQPDLERQKLALEIGGMIKRGPGAVNVQVNQ